MGYNKFLFHEQYVIIYIHLVSHSMGCLLYGDFQGKKTKFSQN